MGWWNMGPNGSSLHTEDTGMVWGDGPADFMDDAISFIVEDFQRVWDRRPTLAEMKAGFEFSISIYEDEA
jgi:hypothetical protein